MYGMKYHMNGMEHHIYGMKYHIYDQNLSTIMFGHIKYDAKYMPELSLTLMGLQNLQNHCVCVPK